MASRRFIGPPGELCYSISGGDTLMQGDVDGDGAADFELAGGEQACGERWPLRS